MGFGDLKSRSGVEALNKHLEDKSYIEGYTPSQADTVVFAALSGPPSSELFHALRWYNHILSFDERSKFPGQKKDVSSYGPTAVTNGHAAAAADDDDDDDIDLFGSSDEEEET